MSTRHHIDCRLLWLGPLLVLPLVYLCQLVPHAHAAHPDVSTRATSFQPEHHSHAPGGHEDDHPEAPHHHHALKQHLDSHFPRLQDRDPAPDQDRLIEVLGSDQAPPVLSHRCGILPRSEPPPESPPLISGGPRAPPCQG